MHLKHGYCMLIHFIHGYYCIYCLWQPLTYLCFPYCISLIYFSFTKIRMFLYAQIYWLAEFGDVSCLQFNYLRVETHSHSDLRGFCRIILRGTLSSSHWYTWRDLYYRDVTSARPYNKVGHLFWFTILALHETDDVILYIHSVHKHRGNSFKL